MEPKNLIKSLLIVSITIGVILLGSYQFFLPKSNPAKTQNTLTDSSFGWKFPVEKFGSGGQVTGVGAYSDIRDPGGVPKGLPVRLQIPSIGVDTAIEDAYITSDGRMDVPAGSVNVAWFALGPRPGQVGSAVIGGHYGIDNGVPKVFYNLSKLIIGDKVYIVDDKNTTLAFVVKSIKMFNRNADASSVFLSYDNIARLNLITCEGVWNRVNDSYPDRRVVFTEAIPSEGKIQVKNQNQAVITKSPAPIGINPSLPATALTPTITPTTTTKPKITPTPTIQTEVIPDKNTGTVVSQSPVVTLIKNMYGNLLDGTISTILIISILFIIIKIFKR